MHNSSALLEMNLLTSVLAVVWEMKSPLSIKLKVDWSSVTRRWTFFPEELDSCRDKIFAYTATIACGQPEVTSSTWAKNRSRLGPQYPYSSSCSLRPLMIVSSIIQTIKLHKCEESSHACSSKIIA